MLTGHDIVCIGLISWQNDYTKPTKQLLIELARHNRVLFVNYAYTLKDVWQHVRGQKQIPLAQVTGYTDRLTYHEVADGHGLHVLIPSAVLPINALRPGGLYDALLRWNTRQVLRNTRRAMRQLGFERPIVLNALHPTLGLGLAGRLGERALVYHCYDAIEAETWSRGHGPVAEAEFMRRADAVVTTSTALANDKRTVQPRCYVVENGADSRHFGQANVPRAHRHPKTIGYVGAVDNRLDADLLYRCFRRFADQRFLFVGRVPDPAFAQRLGQFPNVMLAGPQPPEELPQWVAQMDVGLIPFAKNAQTRAIYPMKINEYLAAGLPVVSTDFADLSGFGALVRVGPTAGSFLAAVDEALTETDPNLPRQRAALAEANSWESRGRQFADVLERVLNPTKPMAGAAEYAF